jgi:transposase InsO family protein
MGNEGDGRIHDRWAWLRHAVIGPLLAAPPTHGELKTAIEALSRRTWRHPASGDPVTFAPSTIERWLYAARPAQDPVSVLRKKVRKDTGRHHAVNESLARALAAQYEQHPSWSYQLHHDNLWALVRANDALGVMPSYQTVRRYMQSRGLVRRARIRHPERPGMARAEAHRLHVEMRSYEVTHVHGLFHADFHVAKRPVLLPNGDRITPSLFGMLDDHSRLGCHVQWYVGQETRSFIHGCSQGIQKRGLPRGMLSDNGSAMIAGETVQGFRRLGVDYETILPRCPEQNGKQESFWTQIEGRLMPMLENVTDLSLDLLNEATLAWLEGEYNVSRHDEIGTTPLDRFLHSPTVGRESPSSDDLRRAFRCEVERTQRHTDGTFSLEGIRYEVPSRYRHVQRLVVHYARWDLSYVDLVDPQTGRVLCPVYPIDKARNADGTRRANEPLPYQADGLAPVQRSNEVAPLLRELMQRHAATGLPPAYVPVACEPVPGRKPANDKETR